MTQGSRVAATTMEAAVAAGPDAALAAVRERCRELADASTDGIFVVGAVGLELADTLREEGMQSVIDPVSDLLAFLGDSAAHGPCA